MEYLKKLQIHIEKLEAHVDGQNMEHMILQNELTDTLLPSVASYQLTELLFEMLQETMAYQKKNGQNEKSNKSKERILKALELVSSLSGVCDTNNQLKLGNRTLYASFQQIRVAYREKRLELDKIKNAASY